MKRILLKQETLDKIKELKELYNIKKDTTLINMLVEHAIISSSHPLINEKIIKEMVDNMLSNLEKFK